MNCGKNQSIYHPNINRNITYKDGHHVCACTHMIMLRGQDQSDVFDVSSN